MRCEDACRAVCNRYFSNYTGYRPLESTSLAELILHPPSMRFQIFSLFLLQSWIVSLSLQCQRNYAHPPSFSVMGPSQRSACRLSNPLIGNDGKIYTCSGTQVYAFEGNGSISWSVTLNYTCNVGISPVHGDGGKIYLVAENRVLKINPSNIGTTEPAVEVFFSPEPGLEVSGEIIGLSVSTSSSSVFINVKKRGLSAYSLDGQIRWTAGPVLYRFGYRQGCKHNVRDCYFTSIPVIDQCEASIYMSNTEGEIYSLSLNSPQFKWIQDFSSFGKFFTITPGNNGRLYVTVPDRALVLALDVTTGSIQWQMNTGPLSTAGCAPVVDLDGWISIGSLDGFLYSFSPTGSVKKFTRAAALDFVVQVSPLLDCSGYAVYISQTEMEEKISHVTGEYISISALKPRNVVFTMLVPSTGTIYWSESYPGKLSSLLFKTDLKDFVLDESVLLAFVTASKIGNPLPCQTTYRKLAASCSQARPKYLRIRTGNERVLLLFLLFESAVLVLLAGLVWFCCIFWRKKKLQSQGLGKFLTKRHSLRLQRKECNRAITELEKKAAEEASTSALLEKLGDLFQEREGIKRKLSTTYSLGRDTTGSQRKALLPPNFRKTKSYTFQGAKKESLTFFHTVSDDDSSGESNSGGEISLNSPEDKKGKAKEKAKAPILDDTSSDDGVGAEDYLGSSPEPASSSSGPVRPFSIEKATDELRVE